MHSIQSNIFSIEYFSYRLIFNRDKIFVCIKRWKELNKRWKCFQCEREKTPSESTSAPQFGDPWKAQTVKMNNQNIDIAERGKGTHEQDSSSRKTNRDV